MAKRRGKGRAIRDAILRQTVALTKEPDHDPSPIEVARAVPVSRQNLQYHVNLLEQAGLIERRANGHTLRATEKGRERIAAMAALPDQSPEITAVREAIRHAIRSMRGAQQDAVSRDDIVAYILAHEAPHIAAEIDAMVADGSLMRADGGYMLPDDNT